MKIMVDTIFGTLNPARYSVKCLYGPRNWKLPSCHRPGEFYYTNKFSIAQLTLCLSIVQFLGMEQAACILWHLILSTNTTPSQMATSWTAISTTPSRQLHEVRPIICLTSIRKTKEGEIWNTSKKNWNNFNIYRNGEIYLRLQEKLLNKFHNFKSFLLKQIDLPHLEEEKLIFRLKLCTSSVDLSTQKAISIFLSQWNLIWLFPCFFHPQTSQLPLEIRYG